MDKQFSRQFQLETRRADSDSRTVPVVVSTSNPVDRGSFVEILSHEPGAIDLSRAPLPLIESHAKDRVNIGLVENLRADGARLRGTVRLGNSDRARELWDDIEAGVVRSVSVGYQVDEWHEDNRDEKPAATAVRWMPFEVSIVSVPADPAAGLNRSRDPMPENTPNLEAVPNSAEEERARYRELRQLFALPNYQDDRDVQQLFHRAVESGWSVDATRRRLLDLVGQLNGGPICDHTPPGFQRGGRDYGSNPYVRVGDRAPDFEEAAVDALLLRSGYRIDKPHPAARDLQDMGVGEMVRSMWSMRGLSTQGLNNRELIKRDIMGATTSSFPLLLGNALNKALAIADEEAIATYRDWVSVVQVNDFKEQKRLGLGSATNLTQIPEGGEYKQQHLGEEQEKYSIAKFGDLFSLTREAIINDDLNALADFPRRFIAAAIRTKSALVYGVLTANENMADGNALFSAAHKNIGTAAAPSVSSMSELIRLMRIQKAIGGNGYVGAVPSKVISGPIYETELRVLLSAQQLTQNATSGSNPAGASNPFGDLSMIIEPELGGTDGTDTDWYLAAANMTTVELGVLTGTGEGVSTETRDGWSVDGIEYKVRLECGAKCVNWRGLSRNAGA